jgi:protein TonB
VGALVAAFFAAGLVVVVLGMVAAVNAGPGMTDSVLLRVHVSLPGAVLLAVALCVLGLAAVLRAPRTAAPSGVKLLSLSVLALSGLGAVAAVWTVHRQMQCLMHTGLTGLPCGEGQLPVASASPEEGAGLSAEASVPAPAAEPAAAPVTGDVRKEEGAAVRIGGAIREPRKLKNVNPAYPDIARQARVQGVVILECTIGPDGRIEHVRILRGIPLLDAAAVEAVSQWVYAPTLVNGVPARAIMTVTVNFKLS